MIKNNRLKIVLYILLSLLLTVSCVKQENKNRDSLRIISMAPNLTEVLFTLGGEALLVGVTDYCQYPEAAKNKERIGGLLNPNLEKIVALQPDVILATESYRELGKRLADNGIKIHYFAENKTTDIYSSIHAIGKIINRSKKADSLVSALKDSLAFYRTEISENTPNAVLVLGRDAGTTRNIGVCGPGAFINEIWESAGGRNAFSAMTASFAQVNHEELLRIDPNLIIEFKSNKNWGLDDDRKNIKEWNNLKINAVINKQIYVIAGNQYLIPGPRMYQLAKKYSQIISQFKKNNSEMKRVLNKHTN